MTIANTELKFYKSDTVNDTASNGGRLSATEIVTATPENIFPAVTVAERAAGIIRWRKIFPKVADSEDGVLSLARLAHTLYTKGDDQVYFAIGTQRDNQGGISSPDLRGCGYLDTSVTAGATSIDVVVEDGTVTIFRDTEKIYIEDGTNSEEATISGAPVVSGNVVTITLSAGLTYSYTGGLDGSSNPNTVIGGLYEAGSLQPTHTTPVVTSTSGTFDDAQMTLSDIGTIEQDWTITFTSSTAFDLTGDTLGAVGSGTTGSVFAPANADFPSSTYFSIATAAWGGTYAAGDTVTFTTSPAAIPVWLKQIVPAGAGSGQSDFELMFYGETV